MLLTLKLKPTHTKRSITKSRSCSTTTTTEKPTGKPLKDIPTYGIHFPYIGNAFAFKKRSSNIIHHATLMKSELGDIYRSNVLGADFVHTWKPEHAKIVFENESVYPHGGATNLWIFDEWNRKYEMERGFFNVYGPDWKVLRGRLQKGLFSPRDVLQGLKFLEKTCDETVEMMAGEGDYWDLMARASFDMFSCFTYGHTFDTVKNCTPLRREFITLAIDLLSMAVSIMSNPFARHYNSKAKDEFYVKANRLAYLVEEDLKVHAEMLANSKEDDPIRHSYFAQAITSTAENPKQLVSGMISFYNASVDTTANTMTWLLFHLATSPDAQKKLLEELDAVLEGQFVTEQNYGKLSYLKACIKEANRITPAALGGIKILPVDIVLDGYIIPSGTRITLEQNHQAARDPNIFEDPLTFKPERWSRESKLARKSSGTDFPHDSLYTTFPFSIGPRMCIGARLAELEIVAQVSRLFQKYEISLNPTAPRPDIMQKTPGDLLWRPRPTPAFIFTPRHNN